MANPFAGITRDRKPCLDRILYGVGSTFTAAAVVGPALHFTGGLYTSPRGKRFAGATQAVRVNIPGFCTGLGVWAGLFSAFECSLESLRNKDDPLNTIIAGASATLLCDMHHGLRIASHNAFTIGAVLCLVDRIMIEWTRSTQPTVLDDLFPARARQERAIAASWFGNLFSGDKGEEKKRGGGV